MLLIRFLRCLFNPRHRFIAIIFHLIVAYAALRAPEQIRWAGKLNLMGRNACVELSAVPMLQEDNIFRWVGVHWALVGLWQTDTGGNGYCIKRSRNAATGASGRLRVIALRFFSIPVQSCWAGLLHGVGSDTGEELGAVCWMW